MPTEDIEKCKDTTESRNIYKHFENSIMYRQCNEMLKWDLTKNFESVNLKEWQESQNTKRNWYIDNRIAEDEVLEIRQK